MIIKGRKTTVGALTNSPKGKVTITSLSSGKSVALSAGQQMSFSSQGKIISKKETFPLRKFYQENSAALGLGPGNKHEEHIQKYPADMQKIFIAVREETLEALTDQERSLSPQPPDDPPIGPFPPPPPLSPPSPPPLSPPSPPPLSPPSPPPLSPPLI